MVTRGNNFEEGNKILYLIATPIGNLLEFSQRAVSTLKECDVVACEDTRNTKKLLSLFSISKEMISCHEHNEEEAASQIIELLKKGKKVCYCSDAGYPCFSDPGTRLVNRCLEEGIKVSVISGPCAAINALVCSGLPSTHFHFEGFLPAKQSEKTARLKQIANIEETLVFYESPHRIKKTLNDLALILGNRKATIARELTKLHEEFIRGELNELINIEEESLKGEMVIVVEGAKKETDVSDETILNALKSSSLKGKEKIKEVSLRLNVNKNRVYSLYLKNK